MVSLRRIDGIEQPPRHLLCVDPGPETSGVVVYDSVAHSVSHPRAALNNNDLLGDLQRGAAWMTRADSLVIEMVASYGMPVGREVFETCVWIGRFIQAARLPVTRVYRQQVKLELCKDSRARDSNIRRAILDLFPGTGGGATPQVGTKGQPGPLYGVSKDAFAALGIGLTYRSLYGDGGA